MIFALKWMRFVLMWTFSGCEEDYLVTPPTQLKPALKLKKISPDEPPKRPKPQGKQTNH